jgi:hypothetical protein
MTRLADDRRGAIMVVATFMAVFACAMLWYLIGVGDAILYRERVQDAADAVAFAGAVYHARGMNLIATLNIIMAALLGLVVAAKLLKFLNDTACVISCGCSAIPYIGSACSAVCSTTMSLRTPINQAVDRLEDLYEQVGPILSKTQTGVAVAMPWLAETKAITVSLEYKPDVRFGAIVSASLAPQGSRKGLPVEDADDGVLCKKVSAGLVDLLFDTLHTPGFVRGWFGGMLEGFVGLFCDGGPLIDLEKQKEILSREEDKQIAARCNWEAKVSGALDDQGAPGSSAIIAKARSEHRQKKVDLTTLQCYPAQAEGALANLDQVDAGVTVSSMPCPFDRGLCEKRARSDIHQARDSALGKDGTLNGESSELDAASRKESRPKIVFGEAENGDGYFQIWSVVLANDARATRPAKGVEMAARGGQKAGDPGFWSRVGWAQAEFYYDTDRAWSDDLAKYDAMWNLRWRARLRRVNSPAAALMSSTIGSILGKLKERLAEEVGDSDDVDALADVLNDLSFDDAAKPLSDAANDATGVADDWNRLGGIH